MPRRSSRTTDAPPVTDYRYDSTRKNIPPAGLEAQGRVREVPKLRYEYDPHLPPVLRFDETGASDALPELLAAARTRPLTDDEARTLAEALRNREPWLEWAGKRERKWFEVDPVALHIHERVSAQAILKTAERERVQRDLFADPKQSYTEALQFYQHDVDWTNRLILGDSLQVMASLARREDLAGKVQMIYMDPPYGIKFASNFQSEIGKRDVKDKETDLTREPEMIKAYRDTWQLGVHSYLSYLRDRLILCRELLADTGSIFVQISDENLHRVRDVMDEVFGVDCQVVTIVVKKKGSQKSGMVDPVNDYLLWYSKSPRESGKTKFQKLRVSRELDSETLDEFRTLELPDGRQFPVAAVPVLDDEAFDYRLSPRRLTRDWPDAQLFRPWPITNGGLRATQMDTIRFEGRSFEPPPGRCWSFRSKRTDNRLTPMERLREAGRLCAGGRSLDGKRYLDDFAYKSLSNWWDALGGASDPVYVVQTNPEIIQRCLLMTTDPGDLVLDPTCGSGTTAYVAEQWGRRWITTDTSRVALAIARQRLLTSTYPHYKIKGTNGHEPPAAASPTQGFIYKTVPHITLKSIAQNTALDAIFARHQPVLDAKLTALNVALKKSVTRELRQALRAKLAEKEKRDGKRSIADADRRRWELPKQEWQEWDVPFDADELWPAPLAKALADYRAAWRAKMDEVNAAIAANAEPEELVDQPEVVKGVVRVSGPFTVEGVIPAEESLAEESPITGAPEEMETFDSEATALDNEPANAEAYVDRMLRLLRADGVRFPNNKVASFARLDRLEGEFLHAEGEWTGGNGHERRVAVSFGPEHGPVTAKQVEYALHAAARRGYDDLVFAGFSFDAAAQAVIQEDPNPRVRVHLAHIRPDVQMTGLLKETPNSQLFTVFGTPRAKLEHAGDDAYRVTMEGVDIYNPVDNTIHATKADKVAAWFLDTDYDGRTFCITQAFFPDRHAWNKLARALKTTVNEDVWSQLSGTTSLPFPPGEHKRVAVKVIDPRGNEVMRVLRVVA